MDQTEDRIAFVVFNTGRGMWQVVNRNNEYIAGDFATYPNASGHLRSLGLIEIPTTYPDRVFLFDQYGPIHAWHAARCYAEGPRHRRVQKQTSGDRVFGYFVKGT
jgi:hypothetical protein